MLNEVTTTSLSPGEIQVVENYRRERRTSILAILFTDIVGSTKATELLGEETYARLRHAHDELFIGIMRKDEAGTVVKQIGDSFLCVFAEPSVAVERAVEFQRMVAQHRARLTAGSYTLQVRIGIHLGQVALENTLQPDVFGGHVNRAARIEAMATAGLVLTSRSVHENAIGWLRKEGGTSIAHRAYGKARLKGIGDPVELFGFYPNELPQPQVPATFRKQAWSRASAVIAVLLLAATGVIWFGRSSPEVPKTVASDEPEGIVYVQVDFGSDNAAPTAGMDTDAIRHTFMDEAMRALYPFVVVDATTLSTSEAAKGRLFKRMTLDHMTVAYYRDTLGLRGVLWARAKECPGCGSDTIAMDLHLIMHYNNDVPTSVARDIRASASTMEATLQSELPLLFLRTKIWKIQGRVLLVDDGQFTFRLDSGAKLVAGTPIRFMRVLEGVRGYQERVAWIQAELKHYRTVDTCASCVLRLQNDSTLHGNEPPDSAWSSGYLYDLEARVSRVFDSTGTATWKKDMGPPFRPREGDRILLGY